MDDIRTDRQTSSIHKLELLCIPAKKLEFFPDRYFITDYAMDLTNYVGSGGLLYEHTHEKTSLMAFYLQ